MFDGYVALDGLRLAIWNLELPDENRVYRLFVEQAPDTGQQRLHQMQLVVTRLQKILETYRNLLVQLDPPLDRALVKLPGHCEIRL